MALNPILLPDGRPAGIFGEWYLLSRRGVHATIDTRDPSRGVLKAHGSLLLTTVRIVFQPTQPSSAFVAFDVPLQGITATAFKQPVFGANRLEMSVAGVPGRGLAPREGLIHCSFTFNEGGCNRLLRVFFSVLEHAQAATAAAAAAAAAGGVGAPSPSAALLAQPQAFAQEMDAAFIDPSDPSTIYCVEAPLLEEQDPRGAGQQGYGRSYFTPTGVGAAGYAPLPQQEPRR